MSYAVYVQGYPIWKPLKITRIGRKEEMSADGGTCSSIATTQAVGKYFLAKRLKCSEWLPIYT